MSGRLLVCLASVLIFVAISPLTTGIMADEIGDKSQGLPDSKAESSQATSERSVSANQTTLGSEKPTARSTRVLLITAANSERCRVELAKLNRPQGDFDALRARGWTIGTGPENHIQLVDRDAFPDLIRDLEIREYPTVVCISEGKIIRAFKSGCTTPLDSWTFGWLIKGKNERPVASVAEPAYVAWTGSYRLRGNHWSVDGDWNPSRATLVSHLRSANHAYGLASNWRIDNWSYEELRSLHDDLHEREMSNSSSSASRSSSPTSRWPKDYSASSKIFGR